MPPTTSHRGRHEAAFAQAQPYYVVKGGPIAIVKPYWRP